MKKSLLTIFTLLFALILAVNVCFAQPSQTPSAVPPMDFEVYYNSEQKVVINKDNNNAAVELEFRFTARGENFSEDFTIVSITNEATKDVYNINKSGTVNQNQVSVKQAVYIPSTKVGKTVEFTLNWKDFSGASRQTSAEIEVVAPKPELSIEAVVDSPSAAPGTLVQIKYVIKNTGNVPVRKILIKDKAVTDINGLDTFTTDDYLSVNGTIIKFVSVVLDGEINLSPMATFTYDGKSYENTGEGVKIFSQDIMPAVSLTCDSYIASHKGADHTFNYQITNTSSVKITNIRVYKSDASNAELIEEIPELAVSQSVSGSYTAPVEKSGFYKFKIVYTYEGADGDKEISAKTDKSIKLPNEVFLQISKVEPQEITEPGKVKFTLLVENSTNYELRDLVITEESNLIDKISLNNIVVPAMKNGEPGIYSTTVEVDIYNDETTVLFNLGYAVNGEHSTINTNYVVNFIKASPTPTVSQTPNIQQNEKDKSGLLIIILAILFLLIVLALIIVLVILKNRNNPAPKNNKKRVYADNDYEDEFDEEFDETEFFIEDTSEEILDTDISLDDDLDDEGVKIYKKK